MRQFILFSLFLLVCRPTAYAQESIYADAFPLGDVTLLSGPLKHASDLNAQVLLQYDVDRLLAPYRKEAGLPAIAESFPNWEGLDGHVGGHYLSALAMYAAQGDKECRKRMLYMIDQLEECAQANAANHPDWGKGYVGGIPGSEKIWKTFQQGDFRVFNSAWVPLYNVHKMYAGLRDAWIYCQNRKARQLYLDFCDWAIFITRNLSDQQMQQMLGMEHGGMNEVLADAYAITGDSRYMECARRFSHQWLLQPMLNHQAEMLDNKHANTQVPKVVGFARIAEMTGDADYREASRFFWDEVTGHRSLSIGGNSRREHFPSKEACIDFTQDVDGLESCNTNNMLKLTECLHRLSPENAALADYYERATFNHILSTQHPQHGGYVYFTSARPRHYRNYSVPNEAMWCCVGTGMENHAKYGQFIYTHTEGTLYVNLYTASRLRWHEQGITLRQETQFPYGEDCKMVTEKGSGRFTLKLRYPGWVNEGEFQVKVNGTPIAITAKPQSYVSIDRKWKKGDCIQITFPMHNSIEHMPNVPQYIALLHGPITLGMETGTEDLAHLLADDSRFGQIASGRKLPINEAPYLIAHSVEEIAQGLQPVPDKPLHYRLSCRMENAIDAELKPFFEIHDSRYMMYWLALSETGYQDYLRQLEQQEQERLALDARTVDKVQPGEQQPESDHFMQTDESNKGVNNDVAFRDARNGHYFSYLMQTGGETNLELRIRYWGQDEWRTCEYDLYADDTLVQTVNHTHQWRSSQWKYVTYPIPEAALQGKTQVRLKLQAKPHTQVGEIYEIRLLRK